MKDITGQKFNRLTARKTVGINNTGQYLWECTCDCGNEHIASVSDLIRGHVKSCGCMRLEAVTKHGGSYTRLYKVWSSMIERCERIASKSYKWYGAKGIHVCNEWHDFEVFKSWAESNGYSEGLSIDRIDASKDYDPSNCRWATVEEQANNKSNNVFVEYEGKSRTVAQWAKQLGMKDSTIRMRLRRGWSVERTLSQLPD